MKTFDARDLNLSVDKSKLKPLYKTQPGRLIADLLFDWAIIIAAIILSEWKFTTLLYILIVLVIGSRMQGLAVLMHEAVHYRFLKNRKLGDIIFNLFCCWPMFFSIAAYRQNHLSHHQHLNTGDDPDWTAKTDRPEFVRPQRKKQFLFRLLFYLTGIQGLKDMFRILGRIKKPTADTQKERGLIVYTILLFCVLTAVNCWKMYVMYWVVPFLTIFPMSLYIRAISEHFGDLKYDNLLTSVRTVNASLLEKFFISPHNINYHIEHHLYPGIPYHNLPRLKKLLMEDNVYKEMAHYTDSYFPGLLKEL